MKRAVWMLFVSACGSGPQKAPPGDSGAAAVPPCDPCILSDGDNYHFSSELSVAVVPGRAEGDPVLDWSGLTTDMHGHGSGVDFVPDDVLLLVFLELGPEAVTEALSRDRLQQQDITLFASCAAEGVSQCALSDFRVLGQDIHLAEYYLDGYGTWLALLRSDFEAGAHAMVFLPPSDAGASTVALTDASTRLEVEVDLHSAAPIVMASGGDPLLDWGGLTSDGQGNPLSVQTIDHLMLARYEASIEELEDRVFDLQRIPDERYDLAVSGRTTARLSELLGASDQPPLSTEGTWLLALECSLCSNPAPKFVARVQMEHAP